MLHFAFPNKVVLAYSVLLRILITSPNMSFKIIQLAYFTKT